MMIRIDRTRLTISRPWTRAERRVVWQGFLGRLAIAVEPLIGALVFAGIAVGVMLRVNRGIVDRVVIASIFLFGFAAFGIYATVLMVNPLKALLQTRRPIYIVDGFIRYRGPDDASENRATGYVAVLTDSREVVCEWAAFGQRPLAPNVFAALVEFSEYGGVHNIDGRSTGALPKEFTTLGIGLGAAFGRYRP